MSLKSPYLTEPERYLDGHSRTQSGREYDSQRQKLYDAEKRVSDGRSFEAVEEMQHYVDETIARKWWERRFDVDEIEVRDGRGRKRAGAISFVFSDDGTVSPLVTPRVQMPKRARYECCLLHELAHCLVLPPHAAHGRLYAKTFLELVRWRMGEPAYKNLLEGYREENVKHHPHRVAKADGSIPRASGTVASVAIMF